MDDAKQTLVWDLPTRIFHWALAAGVLSALLLAFVLGEDSRLFPYHAILGLTVSLMIMLRIVWGFVGSRWARFSSFAFGLRAVAEYFTGILQRSDRRYIGHNPGSSWAIFAMLALVLGLAGTGLLMARGNESSEELHELLADALIVIVVLHIAGVLVHSLRHRENLIAGMIHGRKAVDSREGIASAHPIAAVVFVVVCGAWGAGLWANYDAATQTTRLPIIGRSVQLGEGEAEVEPPESAEEDDDYDDD